MALVRGRFGVEYFQHPKRNDSSGIGKIITAIIIIAGVSFIVSSVRRYLRAREEAINVAATEEHTTFDSAEEARAAKGGNPNTDSAKPPSPPPPPPIIVSDRNSRQIRVRNLLMKLEEAEKMANIVMAVATIEEIRDLPGEPAADIDDKLARRLGELNVKWLFELGNRQWISEVKVGKGDNATRIAKKHGSTLESLIKLNKLSNANTLKLGTTIKVMNHPRFNLAVHKRAKYADLHLNGKFFNRYDLTGEVKGNIGVHKAEQNVRNQLDRLGINLSRENRDEIGSLLPPDTATISISEL